MTRAAALVLALATAGCGRDVPLGNVTPDGAPSPPDAMLDAAGVNPFTPGTYSLAFLDPPLAECMNGLVGQEGDFEAITRADRNLIDGTVTFTTPDPDTITITGTSIQMAIGQSSIDLTLADPPSPPPLVIWDYETSPGDFGPGPDSTTLVAIDLAVDEVTAHEPTGIEGEISFLYVNLVTSDSCSLGFGALFTGS